MHDEMVGNHRCNSHAITIVRTMIVTKPSEIRRVPSL